MPINTSALRQSLPPKKKGINKKRARKLEVPTKHMTMPPKSTKDYEAEVRSWGFPHVFTWTDGPNAHYSPHSHGGLTTHLILKGQLTIIYPNDVQPEKKTFSVGDRIDVEAGRVHEVWMGAEGCTYVIGE